MLVFCFWGAVRWLFAALFDYLFMLFICVWFRSVCWCIVVYFGILMVCYCVDITGLCCLFTVMFCGLVVVFCLFRLFSALNVIVDFGVLRFVCGRVLGIIVFVLLVLLGLSTCVVFVLLYCLWLFVVVDVYGCLFYISFAMLLVRLLLFVYICGLFDILFAVDLVILHVVCAVVTGGFGFLKWLVLVLFVCYYCVAFVLVFWFVGDDFVACVWLLCTCGWVLRNSVAFSWYELYFMLVCV